MELCKDARELLPVHGSNATRTWTRWMNFLTHNLQHKCQDIDAKGRLWAPLVFVWPENSWPSRSQLELMSANEEWDGTWLPLLKKPNYGPLGVRRYPLPRNSGATQLDRVQHAWVFFAMVQVTGLSFDNLGLVFEFGAGTGQMASVLHDLSFPYLHVVYDMPPMLLTQRHWCRKVGVAVRILGHDLEMKDAARCVNETVQTRQLSDVAQLLPNRAFSDTLFVATYSFTEADLDTRTQIVQMTRQFGRMYLMFATTAWDGIDTLGYMRHWLSTSLGHTHRVCTWKHGARGFQLAAVRRDDAVVRPRCRPSVGCNKNTFNRNLSADCLL